MRDQKVMRAVMRNKELFSSGLNVPLRCRRQHLCDVCFLGLRGYTLAKTFWRKTIQKEEKGTF